MRPDHEKLAQVPVAHLGDAAQPWFAAGRVLSGHEAQPGCELTSAFKQPCIRDACRKACRDDRPYSGHGGKPEADVVVAVGGKDRFVELCDLRLNLCQCIGQGHESNANGERTELLVFKEGDELPDIGDALRYNNTKLGEMGSQGVDESGALRINSSRTL